MRPAKKLQPRSSSKSSPPSDTATPRRLQPLSLEKNTTTAPSVASPISNRSHVIRKLEPLPIAHEQAAPFDSFKNNNSTNSILARNGQGSSPSLSRVPITTPQGSSAHSLTSAGIVIEPASTFENSFHHLRFLEKRHQMVLKMQQERLAEEARMEEQKLRAKALRRLDKDQRVDALQKEIADKRRRVAAALREKEQAIQALFFTHPFYGVPTDLPSLQGQPLAESEPSEQSQSAVGLTSPASSTNGDFPELTSSLSSPASSPRSLAYSTSSPRREVPDSLPLLFRTEADKIATMWISEDLRFCVGDRVSLASSYNIPSEEERQCVAELLDNDHLWLNANRKYPKPPPQALVNGTVVGSGPNAPNEIVVIFDESDAVTGEIVLAENLKLLEGDTAARQIDEANAYTVGADPEEIVVSSSRPSSSSTRYATNQNEVSPFIVNAQGVPYELLAVDVVIETTGTSVIISQVTRWGLPASYLERLLRTCNTPTSAPSRNQKQPIMYESPVAILPIVPNCELVAVTADLGAEGVCESLSSAIDEAASLFKKTPQEASIHEDTPQMALPLGVCKSEDSVTLKLVYHTRAMPVVPIGYSLQHQRGGGTSARSSPIHAAFMYEIRFPNSFPARALPASSRFSDISEMTFVLYGVSHWGFLAESSPRLRVKRCPSFQGARAQFTICRKEPWSKEAWCNGRDIVVRYNYYIPPVAQSTITQPNQILKDNMFNGFALTEPYSTGTGARSTTASVYVVPSYEHPPEGSFFKRKLHICVDLSLFGPKRERSRAQPDDTGLVGRCGQIRLLGEEDGGHTEHDQSCPEVLPQVLLAIRQILTQLLPGDMVSFSGYDSRHRHIYESCGPDGGLSSSRSVSPRQHMRQYNGTYTAPETATVLQWAETVINDVNALFSCCEGSNMPWIEGGVPFVGSYVEWVRRGVERVAEHATERSYVTDVVRDVLIFAFSDVPLDEQEEVAKFVNAEARSVRVHSLFCPLTRSSSALSGTFYTALADRTRGGSLTLSSCVVSSAHFLRAASAIFPFFSPCVLVDLAFQFSGPSRVEGSFTSALGMQQSISQCVSLSGDVVTSDGVQMSYRLTRNRRMTKKLPITRSTVPLSQHSVYSLLEKSLAGLFWRGVLSTSMPPSSTWLLPVLKRAAVGNVPYSVDEILMSMGDRAPSSKGRRNSSATGFDLNNHNTQASVSLGGIIAAGVGTSVMASMMYGGGGSVHDVTSSGTAALGSTCLCIASRRRGGTEQIITQGGDTLPPSLALAIFGGSRGVVAEEFESCKPLLVKPPLLGDDYAAPKTLTARASAPVGVHCARFVPLGFGGGSPRHDVGAWSGASESTLEHRMLAWSIALVKKESLALASVQTSESWGRFLLERLWWESVLEAFDWYCAVQSREEDTALEKLSKMAEIERDQDAERECITDLEEQSWRELLVMTEPTRMVIARVNSRYRDARRRLYHEEEDRRQCIEANQQRLATVAALVVASLGSTCAHGAELSLIYPHVDPGIVHGDANTNVHYLLSVIDVFHHDFSAISFLKLASTMWSTRDYSASKVLGSDGGVDRCKQMLTSFIRMEDVVSSVLSTISTISSIRANHAKLCQSGITRDVVIVMKTYRQSTATQLASVKALGRLVPLDPPLLPRCSGGIECLLDGFPRLCHNVQYCLDVLTILNAVSEATPQAHMLVADAGVPSIGSCLMHNYPFDPEMISRFLDLASSVLSGQPLRAVVVSDRWAPRVALHVLGSRVFGSTLKHKALNMLRKLAGNVMEKSSVVLAAFVCPALSEYMKTVADEELFSEMKMLRKRLLLKQDTMSVSPDGSRLRIPATTFKYYAGALPRALSSRLVPFDSIRLISPSMSSSPRRAIPGDTPVYCMSSLCYFRCPATGVETLAEVRSFSVLGLSQFVLPPSPGREESSSKKESSDAIREGLQAAATAMLLADVQANDNAPLSFLRRCLGLAVGEDGNDKVFSAVFEPPPPSGRYMPLSEMVSTIKQSLPTGTISDTVGTVYSRRLLCFPLPLFVSVAEALFDALVVMRNLRIKHRAISFSDILVHLSSSSLTQLRAGQCGRLCSRVTTGQTCHVRHVSLYEDAAANGDSCSESDEDDANGEVRETDDAFPTRRYQYSVDPVSCHIRTTSMRVSSSEDEDKELFYPPIFRKKLKFEEEKIQYSFGPSREDMGQPAVPPPPCDPPLSILLPTVSFASESLMNELEENLPAFDRQCFVGMTDMAAMRSQFSLMGGDGYEADEVSVRVALLNVLAYGAGSVAEVTNEAFELFMEISREDMEAYDRHRQACGPSLSSSSGRPITTPLSLSSRPCLSGSVLQIYWLLQKLPYEVRSLIFEVSWSGVGERQESKVGGKLFRYDIQYVWEELARMRRWWAL